MFWRPYYYALYVLVLETKRDFESFTELSQYVLMKFILIANGLLVVTITTNNM